MSWQWRARGSRWRTQETVPNGGEPVWLTPHQRDSRPEGERERERERESEEHVVRAQIIQSTHQAATFCPWLDLCLDPYRRDHDLYLTPGLVRHHHGVTRWQAGNAWRTWVRRVVVGPHHRIYIRRAPAHHRAAATCSVTAHRVTQY